MDYKEFRHWWRLVAREDEGINYSPGELTFYSSLEIDHTNMSPETKKFLMEGGLPKETVHSSMTFNEKIYTPHVESLKNQILLEGDYFVHYYIIGSLENRWICVDSDAGDQVLVVDVDYPSLIEYEEASSDEYQGEWFMNSSVAQMAECVLTYQKFCSESELSNATAVKYLQDRMNAIDADCMKEGTFWWYETQYDTLNREI